MVLNQWLAAPVMNFIIKADYMHFFPTSQSETCVQCGHNLSKRANSVNINLDNHARIRLLKHLHHASRWVSERHFLCQISLESFVPREPFPIWPEVSPSPTGEITVIVYKYRAMTGPKHKSNCEWRTWKIHHWATKSLWSAYTSLPPLLLYKQATQDPKVTGLKDTSLCCLPGVSSSDPV